MARTRTRNRDKLMAKLAALPPATRAGIREALDEGAGEIVVTMKRLSKSKRVTATIHATRKAGAEGDLRVTITAGSKDVFWARWEEFGTAPHILGGIFEGAEHPGTAPRPFFFPAYRAGKKRAVSRVGRATKKAARQVAGK